MRPFFEHSFREFRRQAELNKLIAENPTFDAGYIHIASSQWTKEHKKHIEEMWGEYHPYADPDFLEQARVPGDFLERCWEMTVACALLRLGHSLERRKSSLGPDAKIVSKSPNIWVESVACSHGDGPDALPHMTYGVAQTLPKNELLLRFSNAVISKYRKYRDSYRASGLAKEDEPFVIAIGKGSIQFPDSYPPVALRYLMGIGDLAIHMPLNPLTGERKAAEQFFTRQSNVGKKSGADVPVGFFDDKANAGISAVIFCENHIMNHPEPLGSDFVLLRNPNASAPLPDDFLPIGAEWVPKVNEQFRTEKAPVKQGLNRTPVPKTSALLHVVNDIITYFQTTEQMHYIPNMTDGLYPLVRPVVTQ